MDLLSLAKFDDLPLQCPSSIRRAHRDNIQPPTSPTGTMHDHASRANNNLLYPFRIYNNGRLGGPCTLFTESEKARTEWHRKLQEALGLRRVIIESNKVFEMDALSQDMFLVPSAPNAPVIQPLGDAPVNGGRITCSVPFGELVMIISWTIFTIRMKVMPDGRKLVAFGCGEGIWIGFMHDPRSKWLYLFSFSTLIIKTSATCNPSA